MSQLKDIFENEKSRMENGPFNVIYLYPEGTFYRAYEWSAWLCCQHINAFKATRREMKVESVETVVFRERQLPTLQQVFLQTFFVLKMDIRGYFMSINRERLLAICLETLEKMSLHHIGGGTNARWGEVVDMDLVRYLTNKIVLLDPSRSCRIIGKASDWDDLPHDKSLFHSAEGCGLPISNLTSQLFSNVYLNVFDQYMKRTLHCKHYGRYVDDFYVVSCDRDWLESLVPQIGAFLSSRLGLTVHEGKTTISDVKKGVEFLGAFVLPYHTYLSRNTLERIGVKLSALENDNEATSIGNALNSYCGVMSHGQNYNVRKKMLLDRHRFTQYGLFDLDVHRFVPNMKGKKYTIIIKKI